MADSQRLTLQGANKKFLKGSGSGNEHGQFTTPDGNNVEWAQESTMLPGGGVQFKSWRRDTKVSNRRGTKVSNNAVASSTFIRSNFPREDVQATFIADADTDTDTDADADADTGGLASELIAQTRHAIQENMDHVKYMMEHAQVSDKPYMASPDGQKVEWAQESMTLPGGGVQIKSWRRETEANTSYKKVTKVSNNVVSSSTFIRSNFPKEAVEATFITDADADTDTDTDNNNYVGTRATCTIPFTYSQKDKSSIDVMESGGSCIDKANGKKKKGERGKFKPNKTDRTHTHNNNVTYERVQRHSFSYENHKIERQT